MGSGSESRVWVVVESGIARWTTVGLVIRLLDSVIRVEDGDWSLPYT
jgi:hypothetical protein